MLWVFFETSDNFQLVCAEKVLKMIKICSYEGCINQNRNFAISSHKSKISSILRHIRVDVNKIHSLGQFEVDPFGFRSPQNEIFDPTLGYPVQPDLFAHTEQYCYKNEVFQLKTPKNM